MVVLRRAVLPMIVVVAACAFVMTSARPTDSGARVMVPCGEMHPRHPNLDVSGFSVVAEVLQPWPADATLAEIARRWEGVGRRGAMKADA